MRFHAASQEQSHLSMMRWLRQEAQSGEFHRRVDLIEAFNQLGILAVADIMGKGSQADVSVTRQTADLLVKVAGEMPVQTGDLNYGKDDLLALLGSAELLGRYLQYALKRVQDGSLVNEKEALNTTAQSWLKRHGR